ncbi:MAG TPA: glucose-6-phosphate dehydrogenase, partial [Pyrinomonadaceae bacterium]|nr:glucose-6-phosphate dehydrogenase [Pyrinomonadaceae bacterium]
MADPFINPLRAGMRLESMSEPCVVVIFGATGDLTKRKLLPALYRLAQQQLIPAEFAILGTARQTLGNDAYRALMLEALRTFGDEDKIDETSWNSFADGIFYEPGDVKDPETYSRLKSRLSEIDEQRKTQGNRIFYLATAPEFFATIAGQLGSAGLAQKEDSPWIRIVVEKPFGHDLQSARELNAQLSSVFREDQIYRIDHYLGKETVQNLLVFRFANSIFEPLWNRKYIDHVQIMNAETIGVEGRGAYYDKAGALRDMMQNHVFQIASLIAMESPSSLDADNVRDEKVRAMQAVRPFPQDQIDDFAVRGQYGPGVVLGEPVVGYRQEPDVDLQSSTETFATVKLLFDNERWSDVPFYLRTGKRLARRVTEIAIEFKPIVRQLFTNNEVPPEPNVLVIRIQPNEGITLRFAAKLPGQKMRIRWVNMDFRYGSSFGVRPPEAYERLLLDCM